MILAGSDPSDQKLSLGSDPKADAAGPEEGAGEADHRGEQAEAGWLPPLSEAGGEGLDERLEREMKVQAVVEENA